MYKLIAIDIDDTLITDDKQVTDGTKQALQAALDQGATVTLATGRMYASAKEIGKQLELNVPIITYQGALIKNLIDGNVIYERFVPSDMVEWLLRKANERGLHIQAFYNDEVYAAEVNEKLIYYCNNSDVPYNIEPDLSKLANLPMSKMIIIDEPEVLDELAEEWRPQIKDFVHMTKSKPNFLEFTHLEATKGHAIKHLAQHIGCDISEVIAIGDSWNDREMIELAGLGVAMGNAVEPLKEIADYVTLSNNEDGVKHVIEKFILS